VPLLYTLKGCRSACVEDFNAIMEFTGWSQNTVFVVFFIGVFCLLLMIVFGLHKFQKSKYKRRHSRYKK